MTQTMLESKEDIIGIIERYNSLISLNIEYEELLLNMKKMFEDVSTKRAEWNRNRWIEGRPEYRKLYNSSDDYINRENELNTIRTILKEKRKQLLGGLKDEGLVLYEIIKKIQQMSRWIEHGERLIKILDELPLISLKYSLSENYQALEFNGLSGFVTKVIPIAVECKINGSYVIKAENDIIKSVLENKTQKLGQPQLRYLYGVSKSLWSGIHFEDDYYIFPKLSQEAVHNSSILIHIKDSRINHSWHGSIENAPFRIRLLYNAIQNVFNSTIP